MTTRVSTDAFPRSHSMEAFRELFGKAILNIDIDPRAGHELDITMMLRALPDLGIDIGNASPTLCRHRSGEAENDDLVFSIVQNAGATLRQKGREATYGDGEAILTAHGDPATCTIHKPARLLHFRFRRERLAARLHGGADAVCRPVPRDHPALRLLVHYTSALDDQQVLASPDLRTAVVDHFYDLAAVALGATRDAAESARGAVSAPRDPTTPSTRPPVSRLHRQEHKVSAATTLAWIQGGERTSRAA